MNLKSKKSWTQKSLRNIAVFLSVITVGLAIYLYKFYTFLAPLGAIEKIKDAGERREALSQFGDYLGGTAGTLLSFMALIFSLFSVYITTNIAETATANNQSLIELQHRPYFYLELERYNDSIRVIIQNVGLGPLLITSWEINYKNNHVFSNFARLLESFIQKEKAVSAIDLNTAPTHTLAPNSEKVLLSIKSNNPDLESYKHEREAILLILGESTLVFHCMDIFNHKFVESHTMKFFSSK